MAASGSVYIALLRGINVGGRNSLPMKDLAAMFKDAGSAEVETYIQSGNVIFRAADATRVAFAVEGEILRKFRFQTPIVI